MSQILHWNPDIAPARIYAAKLARVVLTAPDMSALTDTPGTPNSLNVRNAAGFPEPDAAPTIAFQGTGITGGPYSYYITFYDENTDAEGNPSPQSTSLTPSNQGIRLTRQDANSGDNTRVTHWRVYRNLSLGSVYFLVATVAIGTTTYDDTASDATIQANDTLELDNDAPIYPTFGFNYTFKNFMFGAGPHNQTGRWPSEWNDRITWSKVANPDAWPTLNWTDFAQGQYGIIRALHGTGGSLLIYKDSCIIRWYFRTDPSGVYGDGDNEVVNDQRGAINQRCVVNMQGTHIVMDRKGIFATRDGSTIDEIHYELTPLWQRINWRHRNKFHAVHDDKKAWFFVAMDEDSEPRFAFVIDLLRVKAREGQHWSFEEYDFGLVDATRWDPGVKTSAIIHGMARRTVPVAMGSDMRVHILNLGWRDGIHPELTAEGVTDSGGSTTVVSAAAGTYSLSNSNSQTVDVVGMYLRFPAVPGVNKTTDLDWDRAYKITGVSGTDITVTPAMPATPPAGTRFWIGARPNAVLRTPQMSFNMPDKLKKLTRMRLQTQPGGVETDFRVRYSFDRQGFVEMAETSESDQSRYTTANGDPDITVRFGGSFARGGRRGLTDLPGSPYKAYVMQAEFDASGPDRPVVIDHWEMEIEAV